MNGYDETDLSPLERIRVVDYLFDQAVSIRIRPTDILVVSGFWRSGTTWLQQSLSRILKAKTVFEPFHPAATRKLYRHLLRERDYAFRENFMPLGGEGPFGRELERFMGRALWSRLPTVATRVLRSGPREALLRRIVAKFVRGHLCLRQLRDTFHTPIIHVVRDIRAVVASIGTTSWSWQFEALSLREQLLEVDDGRAAFFEPWRAEIIRHDRQDTVARIVAYWALVERFVEEAFPLDERRGIRLVRYEDLVVDPERCVSELLKDLGFGAMPTTPSALARDSVTTSRERRGGLSPEERIGGWTKKVPPSEVARIAAILDDFGMGDRLWRLGGRSG